MRSSNETERRVFARHLRDALNHLYDPSYLQNHPLGRYVPTSRQRDADQAGQALRQALVDAVGALRPDATNSLGDGAQSAYSILTLRYAEGLDPEGVEERLAISRSAYYRGWHRGVEALASFLWERWKLVAQSGPPNPGSATERDDDAPTAHASTRTDSSGHLPVFLTSFIGREREIAEITMRLRMSDHPRLLTVTGAGGCGKTRLAVQVASSLAHGYPDGVWFVGLQSLVDPGLLTATIVAALGVREVPRQPMLTTLVNYLRGRSILLVLDNCEHLIRSCAQLIADLLPLCPNLQILATSRERINVDGETTWRVPSLLLPDDRQRPLVHETIQVEAVQLFRERARAVDPGFDVTQFNVQAVVDVCRRLDGIPLAIELAAAQMRVLTPEQVVARLDNRFNLLTGGSRAAVPRHQTLRALFDWSHDLLSDVERTLFRRLGVFVGGWTLEAAEAICRDEGVGDSGSWAIASSDVLEALASLVDKSLVIVETHDDEARYRFLETIRQYAAERLDEAGEAASVRDRHAVYYLELAERSEPELIATDQVTWLNRLHREHNNLRVALGWWEARGRLTEGVRLAAALWRFWWYRGFASEGQARLRHWLAHARDWVTIVPGFAKSDARRLLARILHASGALTLVLDEYAEARAFLAEAVELWEQIDDEGAAGESLNWLAAAVFFPGDHAGARALLERGQQLSRKLGRTAALAETLVWLGWLELTEGNVSAARAVLEEGVAIGRASGDRSALGWTLTWLGYATLAEGDQAAARTQFEQGRALLRDVGNNHLVGYALAGLALVTEHQDPQRAKRLLDEALRVLHAVPDAIGVPIVLEFGASFAAAQSQPTRALRLAAAAHGLRERLGNQVGLGRKGEVDLAVARARSELPEAVALASWEDARTMSQDQAVAWALASDDP